MKIVSFVAMGRKPTIKERTADPARQRELAIQMLPFMSARGLRQPSMDELATHLGCSKATLYRQFPTHRTMVEAVISLKLADLQQFHPILTDTDRSHRDRYTSAVAYVSRHLGDASNLFLTDLKQMYPDLWQLIDGFKQFALSVLRQFYVDGIKAKVFHDIDPDIMVLSDELFFDALTDPGFLNAKGIDLRSAFDSYFRMRFHGILLS